MEVKYGGKARPSSLIEAGDIIMQGGDLDGLSIDPLGLSYQAIPQWNYRFTNSFNKFKQSIDRHFEKISNPKLGRPSLNKVVIDFKYMDEIKPTLKQDILSYIQAKYPNYIEDHLIKLNF